MYLAVADVLEVSPGRLLGPDDAQREFTAAEVTLVKLARRLGVAPDEALARIVAGSGR